VLAPPAAFTRPVLAASNVLTLSGTECRDLLTTTSIGRVVLSIDAMPAAFPVNYAFSDETIVFRTSPGTKLSTALNGTVVAFEVDSFDPAERAGWSVLVVGSSRVVTQPAERGEMDSLGIDSWAGPNLDQYVRIEAQRVTGRRIAPNPT
jgi:hypothetical protein